MPFKNISSPRKVNSLNAEIRASAIHLRPELVAMLSNDPVRLAVHYLTGAGPKITNVSLDGGDDVALLSKDVAVVRSGDAVWALIDITHQPKMEQVARDAKSLSMRPSGESALALGWDGTATELKLNKYEVDARQFPLRGDVRSADLTATDTYVVVDNASGGQLRVHPGTTPEPGASWRADLPREAAPLDRIRAGRDLTAVYKRGNPSICIVRAQNNRLNAKMIQLAGRPTDVTVIDTSLFATFADGRVALYNAEALDGATGSELEPTFALHLGASGELRTISVFPSSSPTLWVGTSTGDVMTASPVRKSVMV